MSGPVRFDPDDTVRRADPLLRTVVGEVLRRIRLEQERTLADVASAAMVSLPYLSELERGRKEASSEILAAVCGALEISLSELLDEVGRALPEGRARHVEVVPLLRLGGRFEDAAGDRPGPGETTCLLGVLAA
jgi:transcriptional regulator with XRE-family HTH domain